MWVGNILYTIKVYMRDSIVYQHPPYYAYGMYAE